MTLDPERRTIEAATSLGIDLPEGDEAWTGLEGEILAAYQWMPVEQETRIDRDLLARALGGEDKKVLSFALAVMRDLESTLEGESLARVMTLMDHSEEDVADRAERLVEVNLSAILANPFDYLTEGSSKQRGAILGALDPDLVPQLDERLTEAVAKAVEHWDPYLRRGAIHAIAAYGLTEYRDTLVSWVGKETYGLQAGIALVQIEQDPQVVLDLLRGQDNDHARLVRCLLQDDGARSQLLRGVQRSPIRELLGYLAAAASTRQAYFYDAIRAKTSYRNSSYAPTDYYVAHAAQAAAISLALDVPEVRR